jgi:Preprotein translocase subunit SecA (ATPase, RNA helicase)
MFKNLLGDPNARKLRKFQPWVADINILEQEFRALSDDDLRGKTAEFKERLAKAKSLNEEKEILDEILPEALQWCGKQDNGF